MEEKYETVTDHLA